MGISTIRDYIEQSIEWDEKAVLERTVTGKVKEMYLTSLDHNFNKYLELAERDVAYAKEQYYSYTSNGTIDIPSLKEKAVNKIEKSIHELNSVITRREKHKLSNEKFKELVSECYRDLLEILEQKKAS
ncbi:TPA: hypothetical protein QCU60_005214 [Bacillus cereus]|nr:hypothetical protein [Bacillus cereus]